MENITDAELNIEIRNYVIDETGYAIMLDDDIITNIISIVRKHDAKGEYTLDELLNNYNVDEHEQ